MNVQELNEVVKNNQKKVLKIAINDIEMHMVMRGNNGFNNLEVTTDGDCSTFIYTIDKWMIPFLKEHFENEGYKVEVKEIKDPIKWIEKLLRVYEPQYLMIISWKSID